MNYETWKINYKRPEGFNAVLCGEGFENIMSKFFDELSFAFYLMAEKSYVPVHFVRGLLVSTSGNFTPLFRVTKNELEKKYGDIDFVFGTSDQYGQYVLFFADIDVVFNIKKLKLSKSQSETYRTCSGFCDIVGGKV